MSIMSRTGPDLAVLLSSPHGSRNTAAFQRSDQKYNRLQARSGTRKGSARLVHAATRLLVLISESVYVACNALWAVCVCVVLPFDV